METQTSRWRRFGFAELAKMRYTTRWRGFAIRAYGLQIFSVLLRDFEIFIVHLDIRAYL
jgi:hypothetical protein